MNIFYRLKKHWQLRNIIKKEVSWGQWATLEFILWKLERFAELMDNPIHVWEGQNDCETLGDLYYCIKLLNQLKTENFYEKNQNDFEKKYGELRMDFVPTNNGLHTCVFSFTNVSEEDYPDVNNKWHNAMKLDSANRENDRAEFWKLYSRNEIAWNE